MSDVNTAPQKESDPKAVTANWDKVGLFILQNPSKLFAWIFYISISSGAVLLFFYCVKYNLRYPLELTALPTLLFGLGLVSFGIIIILTMMLVLPVYAANIERDSFKDQRSSFRDLHTEELSSFSVFLKSFIKYFLLHGVLIFGLFLWMYTSLLNNVYEVNYSGWLIFLLVFPVSIWAHLRWIKLPDIAFILKYSMSIMVVIFSAFWAFIMLYIMILAINAFFDPSTQLSKIYEFFLYFVVFCVIPLFLIFINYFLMRGGYVKSFNRVFVGLLLLVYIALHGFPQTAVFTAKLGLNILGIGGYKPICYTINNSGSPQQEGWVDTTPVLYWKLLDIGSKVYVTTSSDSRDHRVVKQQSIADEKSASRNEGGSFYCRS